MGSPSESGFGDTLARQLDAVAPLCVGVDPSPALLASWGLPDDASGLRSFCHTTLEAVGGIAPVVKPQSAFFERHGSAGIAVLEQMCREARDRGLLVLLDVKRGDIGSTCEAYAAAYLEPTGPFAVDAITVSPYLGVAALRPMIDAARACGRGVFIVARSSNVEGKRIQDARLRDGEDNRTSVVQHVLAETGAMNREAPGVRAGAVGVVFGATCDTSGHDLVAMGGPVLAPGLGAQGASVEDVAARFRGLSGRVVPTASRSILRAGPSPDALREAVLTLATRCRQALGS